MKNGHTALVLNYFTRAAHEKACETLKGYAIDGHVLESAALEGAYLDWNATVITEQTDHDATTRRLEAYGVERLTVTKKKVVGYQRVGFFFKKVAVEEEEYSVYLVHGGKRSATALCEGKPLVGEVHEAYKVLEGPKFFGLYKIDFSYFTVIHGGREILVVPLDRNKYPDVLPKGECLLRLVQIQWGGMLMCVLPEEIEEIGRTGCLVLKQ